MKTSTQAFDFISSWYGIEARDDEFRMFLLFVQNKKKSFWPVRIDWNNVKKAKLQQQQQQNRIISFRFI